VEVFTKDGGTPRWALAVVISARRQNISVKFEAAERGDGSIFSVRPRNSDKLRCRLVGLEEQQRCKHTLEQWHKDEDRRAKNIQMQKGTKIRQDIYRREPRIWLEPAKHLSHPTPCSLGATRKYMSAKPPCTAQPTIHETPDDVCVAPLNQATPGGSVTLEVEQASKKDLDEQPVVIVVREKDCQRQPQNGKTSHASLGEQGFCCFEESSEVCLGPHGSWDFPMSPQEQYYLLVTTLEAPFANPCKTRIAVDIAALLMPSLDLRTASDFPMSHHEKMRRLVDVFQAQIPLPGSIAADMLR